MIFATRERMYGSYRSVFNSSRIEIIRIYFGNSYRNEYTHWIPLFPHPETYERIAFKTLPKFYRIYDREYDIKDLR